MIDLSTALKLLTALAAVGIVAAEFTSVVPSAGRPALAFAVTLLLALGFLKYRDSGPLQQYDL